MSKLSISEAAKLKGVSTSTLRRWETEGILIPQRTANGHRRYDLNQLLGIKKELSFTIGYARVSSHDQKEDLARKQKGSKNRQKAQVKLARQHKKVVQIRKDTIHKLTSWLAKNHSEIVIENLNVSGMLKNHRLASAVADCGFYEFRRQLEYKTEWYGSKLVMADRFYPSSQLCSNCQNKQKMPLSKRVYECKNCGLKIDRDLNASINLELYPTTHSLWGSKACGESNHNLVASLLRIR